MTASLHGLGESCFALVGRPARVYHLNAAAAAVARLLAEGESRTRAAETLRERAGLSADQARSQVAALRQLLWSEPDSQAKDAAADDALHWSPAEGPLRVGLETRSYRLLDLRFDCSFADATSRDLATAAFAHLEVPPELPPATRFGVEARGGRIRLRRDDVRLDGDIARTALVNLLRLVFAEAALDHGTAAWALHAAAVARDGRAVLLPGPGGSGKSTLALGLGAAGWAVHGDDTIALTAALEVRPMPLPLCLKRGSWSPAEDLLGAAGRGIPGRRADGLEVRWLGYGPALPMADPAARTPVSHIVFPTFERGASTTLNPLAADEALRRLLPGLHALGEGLTPRGLDALIAWIAGRRRFELRYPSLADGIAAVEALAAG